MHKRKICPTSVSSSTKVSAFFPGLNAIEHRLEMFHSIQGWHLKAAFAYFTSNFLRHGLTASPGVCNETEPLAYTRTGRQDLSASVQPIPIEEHRLASNIETYTSLIP
mmetsp:Transcript_51896/g.93319  ORF Transcript_51896/g.93319 Transcript_51896/m.93319 type:complete len:108 (+) Transcript_51896:299-622(+)